MSRSSVLILVGILTMIIPFIGIPSAWNALLLPLFGLVVVVVGFLIRSDQVTEARQAMPARPDDSLPDSVIQAGGHSGRQAAPPSDVPSPIA